MKELLMMFGVTLAKRYNIRQKRIFFSETEQFFKKLGYTLEYQEFKKNLIHVVNILIGDLHKANYVILCPYDTPSRTLLPYKYFPYNIEENLRQEKRELFLRTLIFLGSCGLVYIVSVQFSNFTSLQKIISIITSAFLLIFCYRLIVGVPNPVNFNRNSASVALIAALAKRTKNNPDVCYILIDKNISSNLGLKVLASDERLKNKVFVYLDCVSHGEKLVCVHDEFTNAEAEKLYSSLSEIEIIDRVMSGERLDNTNLKIFQKMLHLCVGNIENQKFFVLNTRSKKDFKVDIPRLEVLRDGIIRYIGG